MFWALFALLQVYDAASSHCVTTILRPGETPAGLAVRGQPRRSTRSIRMHWLNTRYAVKPWTRFGNSWRGSKPPATAPLRGMSLPNCAVVVVSS